MCNSLTAAARLGEDTFYVIFIFIVIISFKVMFSSIFQQ